MWKIKNMAVIHSNSNPDALIKSSLLVNYIDSKSDKTKSEVYMLLKAKKFKFIPEYDFNCMYMKFDDEDTIYNLYDVSIDWLCFTFYKRYSIV